MDWEQKEFTFFFFFLEKEKKKKKEHCGRWMAHRAGDSALVSRLLGQLLEMEEGHPFMMATFGSGSPQ